MMGAIRWVPFIFVGAVVSFLIGGMLVMDGLARSFNDRYETPLILFVAVAALLLHVLGLGAAAWRSTRRRR